ncbi:MAG: glycosyltransferase, partial [Alphaproteobacteria bacterium]
FATLAFPHAACAYYLTGLGVLGAGRSWWKEGLNGGLLLLLAAWSEVPGVRRHGRARDARSVWRHADMAIFPSRGGEGLPRALLKAAACARPLIVADVLSCRDLGSGSVICFAEAAIRRGFHRSVRTRSHFGGTATVLYRVSQGRTLQ